MTDAPHHPPGLAPEPDEPTRIPPTCDPLAFGLVSLLVAAITWLDGLWTLTVLFGVAGLASLGVVVRGRSHALPPQR